MKIRDVIACSFAYAVCIGCFAQSGSDMSKQEQDLLRHPGKTIPKEAIEGMSHMGELVKKQQEANKAAGVDDHGIPLSKLTPEEKAPRSPEQAPQKK